MHRIFLILMVAAVCVLGFAAQSQAALVYPTLGNGPQAWEDDDFESLFFDNNNDFILNAGDRFVGVFEVQTINGSNVGAGNPTITAVFAIECLSAVYNTGNRATATSVTLNFGALQDDGDADGTGSGNDAIDEWADMNTLGVLHGALSIPVSNDTLAIFYDVPNISNSSESAGNDAGDAINTFDETGGATKLAEFGFAGLPGEFWRTIGAMNYDDPTTGPPPLPPVEDLDTDEPFDIPGLIAGGANPTNQLALNVTFNTGILQWGLTTYLYSTGTNLQAQGNFDPGDPGHFALKTDTNLYANLIPEPGSLTVFGLLFGVAGLAYRRRRSRKAV